jgi:methyl-accepting chemotaxis protein
MIKNLPVRLKLALLYVNMAIFTFPILIVSHRYMDKLNQMEAGTGDGIVSAFLYVYPLFILVYFIATYTIGRKLTKAIAFPAKDLANIAKELAQGNIDVSVTIDSHDEIGALATEFHNMIETIRHQAEILDVMAQGDYTVSIPIRSEHDRMNQSISHLVDSFNHMMQEIRTAAVQVSNGATQIAGASQTLATGSSEQAATVEEFTATIALVQNQAEENNRIASQTLEDTQKAGRLMEASVTFMEQMTQSMQTINESSRDINKVNKVIDDIAFQTNILALNAAVEAARAGVHGKGFAVVADEVRNLASKSADAAKETAALIESSVQTVNRGNDIVSKTGDSLHEVARIAASTAEGMQTLSEASLRQSQSIAEINQSIQQISSVVQANSATAEETAASSEEMSAQSTMLTGIVSRFRLHETESTAHHTPKTAPRKSSPSQVGFSL